MKAVINEESEIVKLQNVMGYIAVKELDSMAEKVKVLTGLGFSNKQMATICDTSEGTIKVQKVINKRPKKKK